MGPRTLLGTIVIAASVACGDHTDPNHARIETLKASAFGTLQTNGYPHSFASVACTPTDGLAVDIYLLDSQRENVMPDDTHIRVTIWEAADKLSETTTRWQASRGPGTGEMCVRGTCAAMTDGHVDVGRVNAQTIEGEIDLRFTNDIRVRQRFRAPFLRRRRIVCG
jgi:hypothetical protein